MQPEPELEVTEEKVLAILGRLYVENTLLHIQCAQLQKRLTELEDADTS